MCYVSISYFNKQYLLHCQIVEKKWQQKPNPENYKNGKCGEQIVFRRTSSHSVPRICQKNAVAAIKVAN